MNIVNVGYRSTNYYVLQSSGGYLLVDIGWPDTLGQMLANLRRADIPLDKLRFMLATHYHPDHAGLAQELKQHGPRLVVLEPQRAAVSLLRALTKPRDNFVNISLSDNLYVSLGESRAWLGSIGIAGEVVHTPGHSDDSVSLVLDDGAAFTGDLEVAMAHKEEARTQTAQSWGKLRSLGARINHPGHGPPQNM